MESPPRILVIQEVASLLKISTSSIYRWIRKTRNGEGKFPLPLTLGPKGSKLRWLASDIEAFLESQSRTELPVHVTSSAKRQREVAQRQVEAKAVLQKHAAGRKKATDKKIK